MSEGTTMRLAQAAGRIAVRGAGKNRIVRAAWNAAATTLRSFARVLHLLFLQVAGVFFFFFAVAGAAAFVKEYRLYEAGQPAGTKMAVAAAFAVMFAWFSVSSFWRTRSR